MLFIFYINMVKYLSVCRTERETAARITEEIGNLMKEIENLVEEKNKDSSDISKMASIPEGEPSNGSLIQT